MKQLGRVLLILFIICGFVSCKKYPLSKSQQAHHQNPVGTHMAETNLPVGYFNRIYVKGPIDVQLIGNASMHKVRLIGLRYMLDSVDVDVDKNTLVLSTKVRRPLAHKIVAIVYASKIENIETDGDGQFTAIDVDSNHLMVAAHKGAHMNLSGQHMALRNLEVDKSTEVDISGINTKELSLTLRDSSKVHLKGKINLREVRAYNNSELKLYWVDSPYLKVLERQNAKVKLAGKVNLLEADLFNAAHFDARYLRAEHSYVKTYDRSRADLLSTNTQQVLAKDDSTVFYYKNTPSKGHYMQNSGAVLNMNGRE